MGNTNTSHLHKAKVEQNNEFYTYMDDIKKELPHYHESLKGKVVLLNCDDPSHSNFWFYFVKNFKVIGLKKLIATHYSETNPTYALTTTDGENFKKHDFKGNGDFRSKEALEFFYEADAVITNPPFTLLRALLDLIHEHKKDFLVVGPLHATTYTQIINGFVEGGVFTGKNNITRFKSSVGEGKVQCRWYTSLKTKAEKKPLPGVDTYHGNEHKYKKYDNLDVLNIDRIKDIPTDYTEKMGVPITFPEYEYSGLYKIVGHIGAVSVNQYSLAGDIYVDGQKKFRRIVIQKIVY